MEPNGHKAMTFTDQFLERSFCRCSRLDRPGIEALVGRSCLDAERGGRLFILGVGGSAAMHRMRSTISANLTGMEAYAPTDKR